jgi:hypothetical protein
MLEHDECEPTLNDATRLQARRRWRRKIGHVEEA